MLPALKRISPFFLGVSMLYLCIAVFHWGLQYKMSLYQNSGPAKTAAPAKLQSHSSEGETIAEPASQSAEKVVSLRFDCVAKARSFDARLLWRSLSDVPAVRIEGYSVPPFFRPPPARA